MEPKTLATLRQTLNPRHREFWRDLVLPWAIGASPFLLFTLMGAGRLWDSAVPWDSTMRTAGLLWMTLSGPFAGIPEWIVFGHTNFLRPKEMLIGLAFALTPLWIILIAAVLGQPVERKGQRIAIGVTSFLWHGMGMIAWGVGV